MLDRRIDLSNEEKENGLDQEEDLLDEQLDESHEKPVEAEAELSLEQQIDDLKDQLLRAQAEVQNVRRVAGQEITKARLYGVEFLAREFLVVGDNLQKALESCNEKAEIDSIKEGLELTLRSFEDSLETAGIVPLSPDGESFDPERHEAISVVEDDKKEPNTVIDVIQKGFTIQNRILMPAKVVVTIKPDKK